MALLLQLWRIAQSLSKVPGALEALLGVAKAAQARDAELVRAHAERLATITGALAANRA